MFQCSRRLRRGGLTSACGFAQARNGRGYRQIAAVNATVLPRVALRKFCGFVRLSRERENRPYTLHPTQSFILSINRLKTHSRAPYPYSTQSCECVRPVPPFFCHSTPVRLWRKRSRCHKNSSKRQSQLNIFTVTVIVVALGRSLYLIVFPAAS